MTSPGRRSPIDERVFHRWLARHLPAGKSSPLPLGDDVAAIPVGGRRVALLTTDALSEGTHFLAESDPADVGRAAAAVSLSDLAAKGGAPVGGLIDLLLPIGTPSRWAERVVDAADRFGRSYGAPVIGGDTKPARGRAVVGTYLGFGRTDRLAPRHGARPGDWVVVTGSVGAGGRAALALRRRRPTGPELSGLLQVKPKVREGQALVRWAHAMTDTSDGLGTAARLISEASRRRLVVDEEWIPWDPELADRVEDPRRRRTVGLYGGDYELLATMRKDDVNRARRALARLGCPLTVVGIVLRGRGATLRSASGTMEPMPTGGWNPFRPALP